MEINCNSAVTMIKRALTVNTDEGLNKTKSEFDKEKLLN